MAFEFEPNPEIQKWKYCLLNITVDRKKKETINLIFLDKDIDMMKNQEINDKNLLQIIAEMGEEGWEMVSASDNCCTIFFKKPKNNS